MTSLPDYITINHHLMTTSEMAEELGVDKRVVIDWCTKLKIRAISTADRLKEYIQKHRDQSARQIAESRGVSLKSVMTYAKDMGIELPKQDRVTEPDSGIPYSFMHRVLMHRRLDWQENEAEKQEREILSKYGKMQVEHG